MKVKGWIIGGLVVALAIVVTMWGARERPARKATASRSSPTTTAHWQPPRLPVLAHHGASLAGGMEVSGRIVDIGGGVIAGATVVLDRKLRAVKVSSDASGRFHIRTPAGAVSLRVVADGYVSQSVYTASPAKGVEIQLMPASALRGVVVHVESGQPVPGALVEVLEGGRYSEERSDERGAFHVGGLSAGRYNVSARSAGLFGQVTSLRLGVAETSEPIVVKVHAVSTVEGRVVVDSPARGCSAGTVTLRRSGDSGEDGPLSTLEEKTADNGAVRFAAVLPGQYELDVTCEGAFPAEEYPRLVVVGDGDVRNLRWLVRRGVERIEGRVVDSSGRGIANAEVNVYDYGGRATTDWRGRFQVSGLVPRQYVVRATHSDYHNMPEVKAAVPAAGELEFVLVRGAALIGTVVDGDGRPAVNADVVLTTSTWSSTKLPDGRTMTITGKATADIAKVARGGTFSASGLAPGEHVVSASPGWWSGGSESDADGEVVVLRAGETSRVSLRLDRFAGRLRGRVVDDHGDAVMDALVHVERPGGSSTPARSYRSVLSDKDGRFELRALPDGPLLVRAHRRGGGEARTLSERGSEVVLVISDSAALSGRVTYANGAEPTLFVVELRGPVSRTETFFRTGGRWTMRDLSPGEYEVEVRHSGRTAAVELSLAAGAHRKGISLELPK